MFDRNARIAANNIKVEDTTRDLLEKYKARHDLPTIKNIKSAPNKLPSVRGEVVHFWVYPVYELVPQEGVEKRFEGTLFITNARLWFNSDEYTSRGFPPRSVGKSTITHFEVDPCEIREGQPGGQRLKVKTSSNGAQADFWFAMSEPYGDVFLLCLSRLVPVGQRTNESLPTADGERRTPDTRSCPNCGHTVPLGARFCASCGGALRAPEQETTHEDTSQGEAFIGWTTGAFPNTVLTRTPTSLMLLFTTDRTVVAKDQAAVMGSRYYTGHVPVDMRGVGSASIEYRENLYQYLTTPQRSPDGRYIETTTQKIDTLLAESEKNYAIPHEEVTQLRVKLPRVLHGGRVTFVTAHGETTFKLAVLTASSKKPMPLNAYPAEWSFLKNPPPKLAGKLTVEGSLDYEGPT